jgi:hypothetical protein
MNGWLVFFLMNDGEWWWVVLTFWGVLGSRPTFCDKVAKKYIKTQGFTGLQAGTLQAKLQHTVSVGVLFWDVFGYTNCVLLVIFRSFEDLKK